MCVLKELTQKTDPFDSMVLVQDFASFARRSLLILRKLQHGIFGKLRF